MSIKIIETSTEERYMETKQLFNEIKPLLDKGYSYASALKKVGRLKSNQGVKHVAWGRDVIEYGESQGYKYNDYARCKKVW